MLPNDLLYPTRPLEGMRSFTLGDSIEDVVWMIGDILLFADTQYAEMAE